MSPHDRWLAFVFDCLVAVCVVYAVVAAARQDWGWSFLFAGCAVACYEVGSELGE